MKLRVFLICSLFALATVQSPADSGRAEVRIRVLTSLGDIIVALDRESAPITVENFLRYVEAGHYEGGRFHRTVTPANQPGNPVKIEVIQAGVNPEKENHGFSPIRIERTAITGIRHRNGTISMARVGPDSATSDFFICIGNQPELDYGGRRNPDGQGFAACGSVVKGMDVVRRIQRSPADGQTLTPPVMIESIKILKDPFERIYE